MVEHVDSRDIDQQPTYVNFLEELERHDTLCMDDEEDREALAQALAQRFGS